MRTAFADTSFFVAALNPRDVNHARARAIGQEFRGRLLTSHYVLLEVATFFCDPANRDVYLRLIRNVENDRQVTIAPANDDLWRRGLELFAARMDKDWSLTDCISFVLMKEQELIEALTADHHFEQAGFVALLR